MSRIRRQIRQVMHEMDARSARVRPGSVLILVVVLLVLMALLGTAYLVTARNDRASTKMFAHNVQIDLLVAGVEKMAMGRISDTSYQFSTAQHYDDWFTTTSSPTVNGIAPVDHSWLASRYPTTILEMAGTMANAPGQPARYPMPKGSVVNTGTTPAGSKFYLCLIDNNTASPPGAGWVQIGWTTMPTSATTVLPPIWSAVTGPLAPNSYFEDPRLYSNNTALRPDGARMCVIPTFTPVNGTVYPSMVYYSTYTGPDLTGKPQPAGPQQCIAASASGNGIADSFLWRLPVGTIDGITYYAAVRIIDNNSQINVNTANSSSYDFDIASGGAATTNPLYGPGIFNSSIGLAEMTLSSTVAASDTTISAELLQVNNYRFNAANNGSTTPRPPTVVPYNDDQSARSDFVWSSVGEALHTGLGRRIDNPGRVNDKAAFQAFSWGDAQALAYRFDLANPNASPTTTEQCLVTSVWNHSLAAGNATVSSSRPNVQSAPWPPALFQQWFSQYLEPTTVPLGLNRRAYFTTRNPLSNLMPAHALQGTTALYPLSTTILADMVAVNTAGPNPPDYRIPLTVVPRVSLDTADVTGMVGDHTVNNVIVPPRGPSLWLGFYNAMADALIQPASPAINSVTSVPQGAGQFRSPIRDINGYGVTDATTYTKSTSFLRGPETLLLRSLLAACNAKDLRDSGDNATTEFVDGFPAQNLGGTVQMYANGTERQVFITEVYANTELTAPKYLDLAGRDNPDAGKKNPKGYVAVELYNPYDYAVDLKWWTFMVVNRTGSPQQLTVNPLTGFKGFGYTGDTQSTVIPPKGYMVVENFSESGAGTSPSSDAQYRPWKGYLPSPIIPPGAIRYYVPNLAEVIKGDKLGGELMLLRQSNAHGTAYSTVKVTDPSQFVDGSLAPGSAGFLGAMASMPPVDSFDFTGVQMSPDAKDSPLMAIHYVRPNPGSGTGTLQTNWKFVYPGRWNANAYSPFRQEGIEQSTWQEPDPTSTDKPDANHYDKWADAGGIPLPLALGAMDGQGSYANVFPGIQLNNTDMGGPNKLLTNQQNPYRFPFGEFARVGDVLQVPFIGSYTILNSAGTQLLEMNPVTRDCAGADDWDPNTPASSAVTVNADDAFEQIGRFCPILATEQNAGLTPIENNVASNSYDPYGWAAHVMDYFSTIQNPNDDYLPNVDPTVYTLGPWDLVPGSRTFLEYLNPTNNASTVAGSVANTTSPAVPNGNQGTEDTLPIEGLININTANWRVLASVPWTTPTDSSVAAWGIANTNNIAIARAIVNFRNAYGPFKTLFDLNKVPLLTATYSPAYSYPVAYASGTPPTTFQNLYGPPDSTDYQLWAGDFSPFNPVNGVTLSDNMMNDFETRFASITRVSNLLTTRSDTYTVYVLVQGWSGVGTPSPNLVVQRRAAFIADRSQLTPANSTLAVKPVQAY